MKIVSYSFFFPERFRHENSDLFAFCRVFLAEVSKNPDMIIKIRQSFKKNEKIQMEMAGLKIQYERFLKALKVYDRDQFVLQYVKEGVVGDVMDIMVASYEDVTYEKMKEAKLGEIQEVEEVERVESVVQKGEEGDDSLLDSISF
jgi:hypothetical protein